MLIKCFDCNKPVSNRATECPVCGCPIRELVEERRSTSEQNMEQQSDLLAIATEQLTKNEEPYDLTNLLNEIEKTALLSAMQSFDTLKKASEFLGLTYRQFRYLLQKHQIE